MFTEHTAPTPEADQPVYRIAVFDMANRAFVSSSFERPALITDSEAPHLTHAKRLETFSTRNYQLGLPALKFLARIDMGTPDVVVHAAKPVHEKSVDFREFVFHRYDLNDLYAYLLADHSPDIITEDLSALQTAFESIDELRRIVK